MKRWILNLLSVLIGLTFSFFMTDNDTLIMICLKVSEFFMVIVPYIAYGMIFFFTAAGIASLNLQHLSLRTVGNVFIWIASSAVLISLTGGFFSFTMPAVDLNSFTLMNDQIAARFNVSDQHLMSISQMLNMKDFTGLFLGHGLLLSIFGAAAYLGYGITPKKDVLQPAYSMINSFSEVSSRLLKSFGLFMNVGLAFFSALLFAGIFATSGYENILQLLLFILLATAIIVLLIFPLLTVLFTRERNPFSLISGLISPAILAFFSGSSSFAMPMTLHHTRYNLGTAKRVTSLGVPIISLFGRAGSACISSMVLVAFKASASGGKILTLDILLIIVYCLLFSLLSFSFPGFEVLFISIAVTRVLSIPVQSEIFITFLLISRVFLQSCAALIDTLSCGIGSASVGYMLHSHVQVPRKERL